MKHPPAVLGQLIRLAAPLAFALPLTAQTATTPASPATIPAAPTPPAATTTVTAKPATPAIPKPASLDLPRLTSRGKPGDLPRLAKTKVTIDELAPPATAGAKTATRQNLTYLALGAGKEWSRPLRGSPNDTTFVSFLAYASVGTVFRIDGAQIMVKPGSKAGYAQLAIAMPANSAIAAPAFGHLIKIEKHDGADLVALPVFTVRLDPSAGGWDLYLFQRLVAEDIPLPETKGARQFTVQPGAQGAWVLSLVTSDENPLYVDANNNGIDDTFEKARRNGVLLAANAPAADRQQLAQQWKENQSAAGVKPWTIRRPLPDAVVASP